MLTITPYPMKHLYATNIRVLEQRQEKEEKDSSTGNRTPSYRVKGGNVNRYTRLE